VTIGDQAFTVNQSGGLVASISMFDPAQPSTPEVQCYSRATPGWPTTCTLKATAATYDGTPIVSYDWDVFYSFGLRQTGAGPQMAFTVPCGLNDSTQVGERVPLLVSLKVTDANGNFVKVRSGSEYGQELWVVLYTCS